MPSFLGGINDLLEGEIDQILRRARQLQSVGLCDLRNSRSDRLVGLVFMEPSLRTRVGFTAAAVKLGWHVASVFEPRASARSRPESLHDTFRTLSGLVDVLVARPGVPVTSVADAISVPFVNGGDIGSVAEHPTQALIDIFAMEQELGPVSALHVAICGDLRMRASRSLLQLLSRRPPRALSLISAPPMDNCGIFESLEKLAVDQRSLRDLSDVDVLYIAGMPHRAIPEPLRDTLRITEEVLSGLPSSSIVLSPLPIIDEIGEKARRDSRIRMFEQNDRSVPVRIAVLEHVIGESAAGIRRQ